MNEKQRILKPPTHSPTLTHTHIHKHKHRADAEKKNKATHIPAKSGVAENEKKKSTTSIGGIKRV